MTRSHGMNVQVYLDGYDRSGDLAEIEVTAAADTHEATTFGSAGWREADPGLIGWTASINGFYDPAAGGYGRQMEDLLGAACDCLSIYDGDANAIGDAGVLLGPGVLKSREQPISVAELVKLGGEIEGSGKAGLFGTLLHPLGAETGTDVTAGYDHGASSANGGRANLHITAITGTWTIKVKHSDGGAYADLVTFTQAAEAGGVTAESKTVTGTVNRYLQIEFTADVAGSITFVCGFARY